MKHDYDLALMEKDMDLKGWRQVDLAAAAGLSPFRVSRALSGRRRNPRTLKRMAEALGHELERYLLEGTAA